MMMARCYGTGDVRLTKALELVSKRFIQDLKTHCDLRGELLLRTP